MKISVDDVHLFTLSETQKKVIKNDIQDDIFDEDMKRRLEWVLVNKYEKCFERLKNEWCNAPAGQLSKLAKNGVKAIPTDPEDLAELIFSQPDYMNRSQREKK